jgi:hypothetical protein
MSLEDWLTWVLLIGGSLTVLGVLGRWAWKFGKVVANQFKMMTYVATEMQFNGGSSMRDAQWRTEQKLTLVIEHLGIELPRHLQRPALPPPDSDEAMRFYVTHMDAPQKGTEVK